MSRRILFVDDEPRILEGLENLMFPYSDDWEMEFTTSSKDALSILGDTQFDVIVSDMRMPIMDGASLLSEVRDQHPEIVRIILSGHAEAAAALRAMPVAHQFLSKPCEGVLLTQVLEHCCRLQEILSSPQLRERVGNIDSLPPRPQTYSEISRVLATPDPSLQDVARVLEDDVGMSLKLIQVANSSFFSRGNNATDVRQAVTRLGAQTTRDVVLSMEVARSFESDSGINVDDVHRDALVAGNCARAIAPQKEADAAFLAGLLHDIGRLVTASHLPEEARKVEEAIASHPTNDRCAAEQSVLDTTHCEVGAYLLGLWGIEYSVIGAVLDHHSPEKLEDEPFGCSAAVYVASEIVRSVREGHEPKLAESFMVKHGAASRIPQWTEVAQRAVESHG